MGPRARLWDNNLFAGSVEGCAALAERAIIRAVTAKIFPDKAALFAGGVVVVDRAGTVRFESFG
jgi:hypothetical protein